jgi:cytochrome P450
MTAPTITYDIYSDESLSNPYPIYEELRSLGSAVWMEPHNAFVLPRYTACRDALRNWRVFASGNGVMMNDPMNAAASNQLMLCTDGERHSKLRSVVGAPLIAVFGTRLPRREPAAFRGTGASPCSCRSRPVHAAARA